MESNQKSSNIQFSIFWHNFTRLLPRLLWIPLLLAVAAAGFRYFYARTMYRPIYQTYAVYRVSASQTSSLDLDTYSYYLDANAATKLAATYSYVMSSDQCALLLREKYGTSYLPSTVTCRAETTILVFTSTADTPQKAYDGLYMATDVFPLAGSSLQGAFTLEIFDEAIFPTEPINPLHFVSSTIEWSLIGLAAGFAIVGLLAWLRKTVHNSEDLRELLNVPCLGILPQVRFKARTNADRTVLLTNPKLTEGYIEAVRAVRFQLRKELENQYAKVIMITSTTPGEGKSTLSANLALTLAEQGSRVILVDCDLRKQVLKELFNVKEHTRGLVELIAEQDDNAEAALVKVKNSDLRLLSGDKVADQPQNFLTSPRLHRIMNDLRRRSDFVIVDTPPSGLLADAASLSQWVDGVIFVVRQDYISRTAVIDSAASLSGMDVRFIGCVLNQAVLNTSATGYGYSAKRGYGYGYGYGSYGYGLGYGGYGRYGRYGYGSKKDRGSDEPRRQSNSHTK